MNVEMKRIKHKRQEWALQVFQGAHSVVDYKPEASQAQEHALVNRDLAVAPRQQLRKPRVRRSKAKLEFKHCWRCDQSSMSSRPAP